MHISRVVIVGVFQRRVASLFCRVAQCRSMRFLRMMYCWRRMNFWSIAGRLARRNAVFPSCPGGMSRTSGIPLVDVLSSCFLTSFALSSIPSCCSLLSRSAACSQLADPAFCVMNQTMHVEKPSLVQNKRVFVMSAW